MNIRFLFLFLLFALHIPLACTAKEYEMRRCNMREVSPVESKYACVADSSDVFFVASAPLNSKDYPTIIYEYPDSVIISDYGFLTTYMKGASDSITLVSVQNRVLRLSPSQGSSPVFVHGQTIPKRLEFAAYAEQAGKDTIEVRIEAGVVPKGKTILIIDNDTIGSTRLTDRYMSIHIPEATDGGGVWSRRTREWSVGNIDFPILREITDSYVIGGDTITAPSLTLIAPAETVEEVIAEAAVMRRAPIAGNASKAIMDAELASSDELLVSLSTTEPDSGAILMIHDILGRQLAAPCKVDTSPSILQLRVRLSCQPQGVFFVSLVSASGTETIKITQ